jgi:hypothetical protein
LAGSLLIPPAVLAARAGADEDPSDEPARGRAIERDDPRARREAMREWRGDESPEASWRILEEARKERDHYGTWQPDSVQRYAAVSGSVFVNVGPTRADLEWNGKPYIEMDSGRARQIIPHPANANILYMATSGGGVWKTFDQGAGWEPISDSLGTLSIGTLAMDPSSPEVLYLGFGDPFEVQQPGLVQSRDGGATWSDPIKLVATYSGGSVTLTASSVRDIKVDPQNSLVVLVATDVGLFRSPDAGKSFQQVTLPDAGGAGLYTGMWSVAWLGFNTWLATGVRGDVSGKTGCPDPGASCDMGLWRSIDDGATWTWSSSALPGGNAEALLAGRGMLATALSTAGDVNTARVFMVAGSKVGDATRDVYRSEDGGKTFVSLGVNASGRPTNPNLDMNNLDVLHAQAWYNQAILVDPGNPDTVYVGGDLAMIRSTNGGQTWSIISDWLPVATGVARPYVHADFHAFAVGIDGTFYAGSDGGIFRSTTAGPLGDVASVAFSSARNEGLVSHLVYNVACAPETWPAGMQGWMAGGMQDNGTRVRKGSTTTFDQLLGGDGIGLAVSGLATNGTTPNTFLASVEFGIYRSSDGGANWALFKNGMTQALPFFVKIARDEAATDPDTFLTFTSPAAMYQTIAGSDWADISGSLHWLAGVPGGPAVTTGFTTPSTGAGIGLRNLATHSKKSGFYGAVSNKYAYVTTNGGTDWYVSVQAKVPGSNLGAFLLSSIALDLNDQTGKTYYITSKSMSITDDAGTTSAPMPNTFGHLYKTVDGGASWTSLGAQPVAQGGLPFVPIDVVKIDTNDTTVTGPTLYVGTAIGLYRSTDGGQNFSRFGAGSLPLVEVTDLCLSPAGKRLSLGTFGRGFWEISTDATANPAGVKGRGDTNFDLRIDGQDLIDLADAWGSTQASDRYLYQADLVGTVNAVDDADLAALLAKFGGQP